MKLKGKVAVVTGGSRGIGRAVCERFAAEGAKVVVNYSDAADTGLFRDAVRTTIETIRQKGGEAVAVQADMANVSEIRAMMDQTVTTYGRVDILVANAGICPFEEFLKIDEKLYDKVLDVNLKGAFFSAQEAMKVMVEHGIAGRLIFTSSVSSVFGGELQSHYCSSKGGINQLMKSIAIAAGKHGITANAVCPGTVITDINRKELETDPELKAYFVRRTPLGRLATPDDIAAAMLFFASDDSACVTGTTLTVDGGMSVNLQ